MRFGGPGCKPEAAASRTTRDDQPPAAGISLPPWVSGTRSVSGALVAAAATMRKPARRSYLYCSIVQWAATCQTVRVAVDVVTEIEIERARNEVSAFAADPANATAWYKNIKAVEWETPPPAVVGSKLRFRARFLGRTLEYTYEVRESEPGRRFVMATAQGPFPMETTYTWEDTANGATRMSLRNRGEPSGFAAVTALVMALAMRRANEADLRRLKSLLEH